MFPSISSLDAPAGMEDVRWTLAAVVFAVASSLLVVALLLAVAVAAITSLHRVAAWANAAAVPGTVSVASSSLLFVLFS